MSRTLLRKPWWISHRLRNASSLSFGRYSSSGSFLEYHTTSPSLLTGQSSTDETNEIENRPTGSIFPWRHEDYPLARFVKGTLEYATLGHLLTGTSMKAGNPTINAMVTAYMFLNVPLYQMPFFGSWKADLADSVSWAFVQGVGALLSNLSHQPTTSIVDPETHEVKFQMTLGGPNSTPESTPNPMAVPLENMLEEKLRSLYETSSQNLTSETELCLQTIPHSAEVVSLYAIPYVSRKNIQSDIPLRDFYRKMLNKPPMDRTADLSKLRKEHLEMGIMESTVIAQVMVWCSEVFYIKDVATGKVLQGSDDHETVRNIPHLVRMETTIKTTKDNNGNFQNIKEDWIITDIDDLLQGNLIL